MGDVSKSNIGRFAVYGNPDFVEQCVRHEVLGHGALCLTAHFANIELMAAANDLYAFSIAIVRRPLRIPCLWRILIPSRIRSLK
ncbi:MAG: hypothetical protein ABSD31_21590 [Candidatus Binataceae bacterium]